MEECLCASKNGSPDRIAVDSRLGVLVQGTLEIRKLDFCDVTLDRIVIDKNVLRFDICLVSSKSLL